MHKIMTELHQDHIHLSRLLDTLEKHVALLSNDGDPDLNMMIDIVDYIRNYADFFHHPKEDRIYKVLKDLSQEVHEMVDDLLNEHQQIPKVTVAFQQLLEGAVGGSIIISREDLSQRINRFIEIQRDHLNVEEEKVFPLINEVLQQSHWQALEKEVKQSVDPMFGKQVEERYESLYQTLQDSNTSANI